MRQAHAADYDSVHADPADDLLLAHAVIERGAPFCANPACALHVRMHEPQVEGCGNWLTLPDGRMFGRGRFGDALLCDGCGTRRGPITLAAAAPQEKRWRARQ